MNIFSGIGLFAAWRNYNKAKAEYKALVERRETLLSAIQTYSQYNEKLHEGRMDREELEYLKALAAIKDDNVNNPEDLQVTTILKVANLVGDKLKAKIILVFSNTSETESYYIYNGAVVCYFNNSPVIEDSFNISGAYYEYEPLCIKPGETVEFGLEKKIYKLPIIEDLRDAICEAAGKRLITSCPKTNLTDGQETADILYTWGTGLPTPAELRNDKGEKYTAFMKLGDDGGTANYKRKPGVLRYCMENSLVGE